MLLEVEKSTYIVGIYCCYYYSAHLGKLSDCEYEQRYHLQQRVLPGVQNSVIVPEIAIAQSSTALLAKLEPLKLMSTARGNEWAKSMIVYQ